MRTLSFLAVLLLTACTPDRSSSLSLRIDAQEARLSILEGKISAESAAIAEVQKSIESLQQSIGKDMSFDPSDSNGYAKIHSDMGDLLISIKSLSPNGTGTRMVAVIGNPMNATIVGGKLSVLYGHKRGSVEDAEWVKSIHSSVIPIGKRLTGGSWNTVEFTLPDTPPDQLGYMYASLTSDSISMSMN